MSVTPLFSATGLTKSFSKGRLFENITFAVAARERIAIIGPNGSGKSTLLKICAGLEDADMGQTQSKRNLVCAYVPQVDEFDANLTLFELLRQALDHGVHTEKEIERKISITLGLAGFNNKTELTGSLSGGWKKRLALARGLIIEPEILLLDEPTNHLDIDGVLWLEDLISRINCAVVFITHDRYFIQRLALRVFELNPSFPDGYYTSAGNYAAFLEARKSYWEGLKQTQRSLASRVRQEEAWLRQGAKARSTKSKQRTEKAGLLIEELQNFRLDEQKAGLEFADSARKTKELIKVEGISKELGGKQLFKNISLTIMPGIRLGVLGANGSGKTTFLNILLGHLKPDKGQIYRASHLKISHFDQARQGLNPEQSLKQALCSAGDIVIFNDQAIHVIGWAKRFLFSTEQLDLPVKNLSGGEQARLLLARLMLQEADIIVFDEPTNDLDLPTLEVLEDCFREYSGAMVLVSHDRYFLEQTTNLILGLTPAGGAIYADYQQWQADRQHQPKQQETISHAEKVRPAQSMNQAKKLGYLEQRELNGMEAKILKAEQELDEIQSTLNTSSDAAQLTELCQKLSQQQILVDQLYTRWAELEEKK